MVLTAERVGGIGGWHERLGPIDTTKASNGDELTQAVSEVGFFDLPAEYPPEHPIRDGYRYSVTVNDASRSHRVNWESPTDVPDGMKRILSAMDDEADWEQIDT